MRISSVLGILLVCSSSRSQLENFLDMGSIYANVENVENAFGESVSKKLIELVQDVYAGNFTPRRALAFFESLTPAEQENAARGIVTMVKELAKLVSDPNVEGQIKMAFQFAPFLLGPVVNSVPEPQIKLEEPEGVTTDEGKTSEEDPDESDSGEETAPDDIPSTDELRALMGDIAGAGAVSDGFQEIVEELLRMADDYNDNGPGDNLAVDDKSTATLSQTGGTDKTSKNAEDESRDQGRRDEL